MRLAASCFQLVSVISTPNFFAAALIWPKASSRSSSDTPFTWSNRAIALRTCVASFSGSLRCLGNAYLEPGISLRSSVESVCGDVDDDEAFDAAIDASFAAGYLRRLIVRWPTEPAVGVCCGV